MTIDSVAIQIPQPLYHRLEQAAVRLQKPVENLLVETLQAALPATDQIPESIQAEVAALDNLDNETLQNVAASQMSLESQQDFEDLLTQQSTQPLTPNEIAQLATLRTEYGRILLRKARAFALLAERGHPLSIG